MAGVCGGGASLLGRQKAERGMQKVQDPCTGLRSVTYFLHPGPTSNRSQCLVNAVMLGIYHRICLLLEKKKNPKGVPV